ncbi:hypothetical protein BH09PLA1_BH09PLA1_17050 [soil metagenome]
MSSIAFSQASYRAHTEHFAQFERGGSLHAELDQWFNFDNVCGWRHQRMYASLDPLLKCAPGARWLTVGDGRCASDAQYIRSFGREVMATDISPVLLREAKHRGLIDDFRVENAESLSFADDAFEFVLCKESYHHFPRPMIALYEMLRVASVAVILIEPFDRFCESPLPERMWNGIKRFGRRMSGRSAPTPPRFQYETVGNFIYTISRREIEKVAAGMNLGPVAFRAMNDCFWEGMDRAKPIDGDPTYERAKHELRRLDLLCRLRIRQPRMLSAILFKAEIDAALRTQLIAAGFELPHRPPNPYLS